jgi:hypothetical protein
VAERVAFPNPPKCVRLRRRPGAGDPNLRPAGDGDVCGNLESHEADYCPERVFEMLPDALKQVRRKQKVCTILVESDADPTLRFAYGYDVRVFVLPPPRNINELFRRPHQAAQALKQVMDDTAAFASEIFGLFEHGLLGLEDAATKAIMERSTGLVREHLTLSADDVKRFLGTPLGVEIASRIQLQPLYHGLAESDLVLVNTGIGEATAGMDRALRNLEMFLARIGETTRRLRPLYRCDLRDPHDPSLSVFLYRFASLALEPPPALF